jgi:UPF0755 protein
MKRMVLKTVGAMAFVGAGIGASMAYVLLGHPFRNAEPAYLYVYPDDKLEQVEGRLRDIANPSCMWGLTLSDKIFGLSDKLRTGRYEVTSDMNMLALVRRLKNHAQAPVNLVVPSVRTVQDMAGRLGGKLMVDSAALADILTDSVACAKLGYTTATVPALFIPNTYQVYWDISIEDFLKRLVKENQTFWTDDRQAKSKALGMSREEVVTLASIVDSETANNLEKPRIAGLYLNRIRVGMPLQSDPTVVFAVGDFSLRRILRKHLMVDSPYNTYIYKGLPPGPIRIPSVAGIDAVLNHETHSYLYMCAKEDFSGTHNFATSYAEHQQNARRYAKALDARGIK